MPLWEFHVYVNGTCNYYYYYTLHFTGILNKLSIVRHETGRSKGFFSSPKRLRRFCGTTASISYRGSFPGVNRPDSEVHYLLPSKDTVKNGWSKTSTPYISLHGVQKDNSTFTLYVHMQKTVHIYCWLGADLGCKRSDS